MTIYYLLPRSSKLNGQVNIIARSGARDRYFTSTSFGSTVNCDNDTNTVSTCELAEVTKLAYELTKEAAYVHNQTSNSFFVIKCVSFAPVYAFFMNTSTFFGGAGT